VFSDFFEATREEWQRAMDVNARSLLLGQAAARHMKERGGGAEWINGAMVAVDGGYLL